MQNKPPRKPAVIVAEMLDLGPFIAGTVRKDKRTYHKKDGTESVYPVASRLNIRCGSRRKDIRIRAEALPKILELTENYKRFLTLVRELEDAITQSSLDGVKKKN